MPLPPDLPTHDPDLNDAREFTNDEVTCLAAWLKAAVANDYIVAEDILQTGLLAEHYRSRIFGYSEIPPTQEQFELLAKLRAAAKAARRGY